MGKLILKLNDGTHDWYMEWTSVSDSPATYGMSLDEFTAYYREKYGTDGERGLAQRLARANANGSSSLLNATAADEIAGNRAGLEETELTMEQIIEHYCTNRPVDKGSVREPPMGKRHEE